MSQYDMFVYFYSDDIDPTDGSIDDTIIKFDEVNFNAKTARIRDLATSNFESSEDCDALLQEFHRTIENRDVPEWQGATVGQVCLAEGTTVYVKLEDIMRVFLMDTHMDDLVARNNALLEPMIGETFHCAEELFYSSDRNDHHADEEFVFGSCRSTPSHQCSLAERLLPYDIDKESNRDQHGQLFGTNASFEIHYTSES